MRSSPACDPEAGHASPSSPYALIGLGRLAVWGWAAGQVQTSGWGTMPSVRELEVGEAVQSLGLNKTEQGLFHEKKNMYICI